MKLIQLLIASTVLASGAAIAQSGGSAQSQNPQQGTSPGAMSGSGSSAQRGESSATTPPQGSSSQGAMSGSSASSSQHDRASAASSQSAGQSSEVVRQAQQALKDKGHDVGAVDGVLGPSTEKGLKEFQQAQGKEPTGRLDSQTLAALGISGASASSASRSDAGSASSAPSGSRSDASNAPSAKSGSASDTSSSRR